AAQRDKIPRGPQRRGRGSRHHSEAKSVRSHLVRVQDARAGPRSVRGVPRPPGTQNAPPPDGGSVEDRAIARRVPGGPSRGPRGPLSGTAVVSPTRSGEEADGRFWGNALLRTERRLSGREAVRGIGGRRHPRREPR